MTGRDVGDTVGFDAVDLDRHVEKLKAAGIAAVVVTTFRVREGRLEVAAKVGIAGTSEFEVVPTEGARADVDAVMDRVVARGSAMVDQYGLPAARRYKQIDRTFKDVRPEMREELLGAARSSNADLVAALTKWLAAAPPDLVPRMFGLIGKYRPR